MDKLEFYWNGFEPIFRILIVGTLAYLALIFILRVSGKRTLAKMNAFDFIITVTIGSALGRILTAKDVSVSEAVTALFLLVFLQFIFSWLESRYNLFKTLITSQPTILYYKNDFIEKNLRKERLGKNDVVGSIRKQGFGSLEDIEIVIMETDGTFSVIGKSEKTRNLTYRNLLDNRK